MNQYTIFFLKKLSFIKPNLDVNEKINRVAKFFHMNELELTIWSLCLKRFEWKVNGMTIEEFVYIIGLQIKAFANPKPEFELYFEKFQNDFPRMKKTYENWIKDKKHEINFDLREINKEYKVLRRVLDLYKIDFISKCMEDCYRG